MSIRAFIVNSFLIILLVLAYSCRAKKPITNLPNNASTSFVEMGISNPDSLSRAMQMADAPIHWFGAKVSVNSEINNQTNSFTANIRIKKDSAIWISISPALGIEVARALITPDSLKFINRINGTFFKGDYKFLNELLQIEVNFKMIQAILLGNVYLHYSIEQYISDRENSELVMSTIKKRRIRRDIDLEIPQILTQEIWFSSLQNKIIRMEMQDYRPVRKFTVNYLQFEKVDEQSMPSKLIITAQADKQVKIDLEYSRMTINKELNLPFNIPEDYVSGN